MYEIQEDDSRALKEVRLLFRGFIKEEEMKAFASEAQHFFARAPSRFVVRVDMRGLKPLPAEAQKEMERV